VDQNATESGSKKKTQKLRRGGGGVKASKQKRTAKGPCWEFLSDHYKGEEKGSCYG